MKKVILGVGVAVSLLIAYELSPWVLPIRHQTWETQLCERCGIRRETTTDDFANPNEPVQQRSWLKPTKLSIWFKEHYPNECSHFWRRNHHVSRTYTVLAGYRFRDIGGEAGSSVTPFLVSLAAEDQADLELRFAESPESCRKYIFERLKRRHAESSE